MTYKKLLSKTISVNVSILLLIQQSIIAGEIIVDSSANIINQATIEKAPNNVPVVNIVKPNETGLSHNKFSNYNVNKEGLILNNSNQREVNTQLAGYIYGNKNLAGGNTAKTILNEVTSRNKTELRGFTEVAGDRANVVVANPNGIYINGAGFINTSKATITTGNISTINGNINHRVENGTIEIDAEGLNVSNVDKAELYAKTVKLNAQIHAKDIDIVTGKNKISEDGTIEKIDEVDTEKPSFSLDSSSLGGIYANKINLIGTQDGVGINLPIEITAQDDLKISADGKINLDRVVSNKNLEIKSNSNDVDTNIIYAQNVNIEAKNKINNKDIIASKTDINLKATKIVNKNLIASGVNEDLGDSVKGNLNISSDELENKKTIYAKDNVNINTKEVVNTKEAVIKSKKEINIISENISNEDNVSFEAEENINLKNQNKIVSNKINIVSKQASVNIETNTLEIKNSKVNANKDVILKAEEKIDAEDINVQANKIDVSTKELILSQKKNNSEDLDSKIVSNTTIDITANNIKNVNGYIGANEDINITSKDIDNSNGVIVTNENLNINSQEDGLFNNLKGILQASKNLVLNVFDFKGDESIIQAENVNVKANDVNGKSLNIVALNGDLKLDTNNLNLSGDNLSKGLLYSTNDILINSKKFISNYLNVQANNNIDINSLDIALNNSTIQSVVDINDTYVNGYKQGNINLITSNLNLENVSLSSKDLTIKNEDNNKIQSLIVNNSILDVNNDINIQASVFNTKNSTYSSLRSLSLEATSIKDKNQNAIFTNSIFNSGNSMNITVDDDIVLDSSNKFEAINSITLNSKSLTNNAQFISNDNITINTSDYIINNASLSSGNTITLNAVNYITNNDSNNELFGIRGAFTNLNTNLLTNYGLISSLYEMNIKANDIVNYGGIASANTDNYSSDLNITANNLSNYNTIYSNDDINLFIKENILNQNATIFATNNITIQGDENKTLRTNSIVNKSAVIQTNYGDINIFGNSLENASSELNIKGKFIKNENGAMYISGGDRIDTQSYRDSEGYSYNYFTVYTDVMTYEKPEIAQILSGKDIYFDTNNVTNNYSLILANNDLYFESDVLSNSDADIVKLKTINKDMYYGIKKCKWHGGGCSESSIYNGTAITYEMEIIDKINSTIKAGGSILGSAGNLINGNENATIEFTSYNPTTNTDINNSNLSTNTKSTQNQTVLSNEATVESIQNEKLNPIQNLNTNIENNNYELPTNKYGMFITVDSNKNLNYLVESNPLYTNMSNFTGSQYFLDKMNYQGDRITKRLGDAAYETKLITDSIVKQTGQRFIGNYTSENAQFVALMDNAINLSGILGLEIGQALTQNQLANLTEDIVWMEEKIVNNQKVLVPVVYLASDYEHLKGASIIASSIDLKVKDSLNNSGNIRSKDYLNLNANAIINNEGVILSDGKATLISQNDFLNKNGGIIKASDVQIASINGDIINQTFFQQNTVNQGANNFTYTQIGNQSQIEATKGNLVLQSNNNIENLGANISALKNLSLNAINGDVNLKTIELKNEHNINYGGGFNKSLDIEHLAATASAGENVIMKSGNNINLENAKIDAVNQINLNAQNDVNITAVNDVHYTDVQTSKKGTFSKKTQRDMVYKEEVNSAQLNANDIVINAKNDVNLEASKLKAQDNIVVFAKDGDVNVLAKEYKEGELHSTKKSSFAGLKKSLDIKSSDALKLNSALLETQAANVVITSGKDINILASEINSGNLLLADAKNNLNIMSDEEIFKQEEIHKKTSFSPSFSGNMLVYAQEKTNSDKNLTTTQIASNLSGKEVMLQAQNELTIIGSNVVGEDITLKANDINLLSATQSASNEHSESTKKIGVEVTLNSKEASIFAGGIVNKDEINKGNTTQLASNIVGDNVTLISKDNTNIMASNIMANNDLILASGKNINVLSQEATDYKDKIHTYLKAGISLGVKQNITDGAKNIADSAQSIAKSDNAANAGFGTLKLIDTVSSTLSNPVSAGLNAVAIVNKNTSSSTNQTVQSSNIYAENNATFVAGEDVNIKGSNVYSQNNLDIYAKNLNVEASAEKSNSKTTDKNMDLSVGLYGTNAGKVDLSVSQAKQTSQSTNYVNSNIQAKNLNLNIDNNAKFEGANIQAKDINATVGNNLTIASLQNSSNSNGSSSSLSLGTSGNGSIGVGVGKNNSQRDWVDNQTTIIGTNSVNVNVGNNTHLKGALLASGNYNEKGNFVDNKNLNLITKTLTSENINDKDNSSSYNLSVGVDKSENETQAKMELGLSNSQKEQINYATIGNGNIEVKDKTDISNVNRDVNKSQVITKDKNSNLDIYLSNTSISKALDPSQTIAKWGQDSKDLGLNVRNEIMQNLPSATKLDKDGNGNIFDKTIGKALDATTDYGMGIIPTVGNAGGYVTQIATQLFGDNRTGIVVENKDVLLKAGILEGDIKTETLVKTKDGIKKVQDVKDTDVVLDTVTVYRTDPDKTIIISENQQAIEKEQGLSDYNNMKIYLTKDDVEKSGINHLFTNGMFNPFDTATYNQQTQQGKVDAVLNYNQTHGLSGDLLESAQDALVVMGTKFMNFIGASDINPYLSYLGTGGAKQTGNIIDQMVEIRKGDLTVGGHSQGTLMTQLGLQQNQENIAEILKNNPDSKLLVGYAGSPVNHYIAEKLLTDIYGGEEGIKAHIKDGKISDVFRSQVNPQDFVGSFLGGQSAGVNNSEKLGTNMWSSFISLPMLFGVGGDSSHSYYPCVIGCGNNNTTPAINYYFNKNDEKGRGATELTNYYSTQLPHVNQNLLPSSQAPNSQISIDTKGN